MKPFTRPSATKDKSPPVHKGAGEVRIIGGQWRRTKLPVANKSGLRPTPDRVRETLFNWLGQSLLGWKCADIFAGTGALGLEAASREASVVQLCEQDTVLVEQLQAHIDRLKASAVHVQRTDGVSWLARQAPQSWDVVFIDPPFESQLFQPALKTAALSVKYDGWIYLEAPKKWNDNELSALGLQTYRYLKAGNVHAHLLQRIA
jgi:16S rRNA (guanine(966)-N(2))-methyltransferase RsmD